MPIIKILKKGLLKAQAGVQAPPGPIFFKSPRIVTDYIEPDMMVPDDPEAREQEQRQQDAQAAYRQKYPNAPVDAPFSSSGVFDMRDSFQKQYDSNPGYAADFDTSIFSNAMENGSRSQAKAQAKFFNNKYNTNYKAPILGAKPRKALFKTADAINIGTGVLGIGVNLIDNAKKQKYFNSYMRNSMMPDNLYSPEEASTSGNRGDYDINNGMFRPNELGFKSKGQTTNAFYPRAQFGGTGDALPKPVMDNYISSPMISMEGATGVLGESSQNINSNYTPKSNIENISNNNPITNINISDLGTGAKARLAHNNPGNIHIEGKFAKKYGATMGRPDGDGHVAIFPDMQTGLQAMKDLLFGSAYNNLTISQARNKWVTGNPVSGNSSTAEIVRTLGSNKKLSDLSEEEKNKLFGEFVKWEDNDVYKTLKSNNLLFENGGSINENMKIRIIDGPDNRMEYGGQKGYGLDLGAKGNYGDMNEGDYDHIGRTLGPVDREDANLEAERGETVLADIDNDGMQEHMTVGGKLHSDKDANGNGGTPLNLPEGSFVFSNTKKMKIKDPEILKHFNKTKFEKGGVTPASIAKQYDINKYKAILDNPNTDILSKKTAAMMITNFNKKLGALALVQESMKGFPQGIPEIAKQALGQGQQQETAQEAPQEAKFGGYIPVAAYGYDYTAPGPIGGPGDEYKGGKTSKGRITPTGYPNAFNMTGDQAKDYYNRWEQNVKGYSKLPVKDAQEAQYDWMLKNNPEKVRNMWKTYGLTAEGKKYADLVGMTGKTNGQPNYKFERDLTDDQLASLKKAYTDNMMGVRQFSPETTGGGNGGGGGKKDQSVPGFKCINGVVTSNVYPNMQAAMADGAYQSDTEAKAQCSQPEDIPVPNYTPNPGRIPYGWAQQDINNSLAASFVAANMKKYHPWTPKLNPVLPDVVYDDWRAKAAASQSQFNNAANTLGTYAGGPGLTANLSFLAGQTGERVDQAIDTTSRTNTNIFNNAEAQRANILNQFQMINGQNAANNWSDENALDSKYRAAQNDALRGMVAAQNQGITNAADRYNINISESPYYYGDPRMGTIRFNNRAGEAKFRAMQNGSYQPQSNGLDSYDAQFKAAHDRFSWIADPKLRIDAARDYMEQYKPVKTVQSASPGQFNRNRTQTTRYTPTIKKGGVVVGYNPYNPYLSS